MLRTVLCLFLILGMSMPLHAEDDPAANDSARAVQRMSLIPWRAPWLATGPQLQSPVDDVEAVRTCGIAALRNWQADEGDWLRFSEPDHDRFVFAPDVVIELMQGWEPGLFETEGHQIHYQGGDEIQVTGPARVRRQAQQAFDWITAGLAPSVGVRATLQQTVPEAQLLAMSQATLYPGRWTRVYLDDDRVPFSASAEIEIAQQSTVMRTQSLAFPQGQELYMRLHPGESRSIVEIWSAELRHLETRRIDLSGIRNVPEAAAVDELQLPITAMQRGYAAVALPTGKATRHVLRFRDGDRIVQLQLAFDPAPAPHEVAQREGRAPMAILRVGAVHSPFAWNSRNGDVDGWVQRMIETATREGFNPDEFELAVVTGSSCLVLKGPSDLIALVRRSLQEAEAGLRTEAVGLRVVTLPQAVFLEQGGPDKLRLGRPIDPQYLARLRPGGAVSTRDAGLSLIPGMRGGIRLGHATAGLTGFSCEVAQESGGLVPRTGMAFEGLRGDVRVHRQGGALHLSFRGWIQDAHFGAGEARLLFRPPLSMERGDAKYEVEDPTIWRRSRHALLGCGASPIDASVRLPDDGAEVPLAVTVRGSEVHVLLGRIDPR